MQLKTNLLELNKISEIALDNLLMLCGKLTLKWLICV